MALDPKTLHPVVWAKIDRIIVEGFSGNAPNQKAVERHGRVWMKESAPGCAAWTGGLTAAVVAATMVAPDPSKTVVATIAVVMAIVVFGLLVKYNMRQLSNAELRALAPGLELSPAQKAYVEAVLILDETKLGSDSKREVIAQMNSLLDEEASLVEMRNRSESQESPPNLEAEREEIQKRLASTTDPITRQALERSAEICEGRILAAREKSVVIQRIDAQLTMIAQSTGHMRDTLERLHTAPVRSISDIDMSPIRKAIEQSQAHATALEAAVDEIESAR